MRSFAISLMLCYLSTVHPQYAYIYDIWDTSHVPFTKNINKVVATIVYYIYSQSGVPSQHSRKILALQVL